MSEWWHGLRPELAQRIAYMLWATNSAGFPTRVSSGYRSREKQEALYRAWLARGRTGLPVARPGTSRHELGEAADVVWVPSGVSEPYRGAWAHLGQFGESIGLRWLGMSDPVHFELPRLGTGGLA